MEKRNFSRVGFKTGVLISSTGGGTQKGEVVNVSLRGILIRGIEGLQTDDSVEVTIYLTGVTPEIPVQINGTVVRVEEGTVAVKFHRMDTDSFIHLRKIVAHNIGDEGKVMDEFIKFHIK